MSDMELYSQYFPVGKKVGVGIPLPNANVFNDWASILEIDEDLVSVQLSRDVLPAEVTLHYGSILELRVGSDENGYCCRAIVVSEGDERILLLRLIGEIVSDELREFYRIDAFLPIKYFVSHEQNIDQLGIEWEKRRERRFKHQIERKDLRWSSKTKPAGAELPQERLHDSLETDDEAEEDQSGIGGEPRSSWDEITPLAANVSGGGLRFVTHQGFELGEYIILEIFVPTPERVIDVVGRVVFANRNYAAGSDHEYFNTGVQFVYLDEQDRDAFVSYISRIQLKRIRQLREQYLFRSVMDSEEFTDSPTISKNGKNLSLALSLIFFVAISFFLVSYFWQYAFERPKGELQRTFEEGVRKYREQQKPN